MLHFALAWLALVPLAAHPVQGAAPGAPSVDFAAFGAEFVSAHCPESAGAPCPLEEVLARGFARLDLGPFSLESPRALLADKGALADVKAIAEAVLASTHAWLDWQGALSDADEASTAVLAKWIGRWKPLKPGQAAREREFLDAFAATEEDRAACTALRDACDAEERVALRVPEGRQQRLILAPTRLEFVQWVGYAGLSDEAQRAQNWRADTHQWSQFWLGWDMVLALEYSPWTGFDPTFRAAQPMNGIGAGVMAQHVVQQGMTNLLRACRPTVPESRYDSALAMLSTILACGEINTIEGAGGVSSSGASTAPYSRFVPGGNPDGGTLPGRSAAALSGITENHWREGHGSDGFVAPLKEGQAEGAKAVKKENGADARAHFILKKEDGTGEHLIHAPFFGPHADEQRYPPGDYLVDYAEFYRAYKAAFFHWLATRGPDPQGREANTAKWQALVRGLGGLSETRTLDTLVAEVYGLPISGRDGSTESLEWRFLSALPKLK